MKRIDEITNKLGGHTKNDPSIGDRVSTLETASRKHQRNISGMRGQVNNVQISYDDIEKDLLTIIDQIIKLTDRVNELENKLK